MSLLSMTSSLSTWRPWRTTAAQQKKKYYETVLEERKELRQQLDAKEAQHVAAIKEASEQQRALFGEVQTVQEKLRQRTEASEEDRRRLGEAELCAEAAQRRRDEEAATALALRQSLTELQRTSELERRQREDAERKALEARSSASEAALRTQALEKQLAEAEELLRKEKDKSRQLESRLQGSERAAKALEDKAAVAAQMGRAESASELAELKAKYAELSAAKDKELQVALLELQTLAQGQELLRTELRNSLRPLPSPPWPSLSPPPRPLPRVPTVPWHGRLSKPILRKGMDPLRTFGDSKLPGSRLSQAVLPMEPTALRMFEEGRPLDYPAEPVVARHAPS
ncbi:unnamed protein product [Symbiodinium pilosum]|uniref:Reticulocyte-binding protein 2-like a n=1 Tax=Symbiodinium pilosum TaxID=2952 RepID=A0A812IU38_SYMPI|nr:unnamed protein product [Symbiodinium pilosum]